MSDSKYICSDDGTTFINKDFISSFFIHQVGDYYHVIVHSIGDDSSCMCTSRDKESAINYYKHLCDLLNVGNDLSVDIKYFSLKGWA